MAHVFYNPNPKKNLVGDCVIRGISKLTDQSWKDVYMKICLEGYSMCDMPTSNAVSTNERLFYVFYTDCELILDWDCGKDFVWHAFTYRLLL